MIVSKALLIDGFALMKVWAVGFFGLHIAGIIHLLPVIAISAIVISFLARKTFTRKFIK